MILSYDDVDAPSGVSLSGWDPKDSQPWSAASASIPASSASIPVSSDAQAISRLPSVQVADASNPFLPEFQDSRGSLDLMYEERKAMLLLLLQRMNSLELSERGDMELLNSLWKLLNSCSSRDYFTLIREFLPFVILHYSVRQPREPET